MWIHPVVMISKTLCTKIRENREICCNRDIELDVYIGKRFEFLSRISEEFSELNFTMKRTSEHIKAKQVRHRHSSRKLSPTL